MKHAIRVENLSKMYRIGLKEQRHETFVGSVLDFLRSPATNLRQLRGLTRFTDADVESEDVIWALRNLTFEVPEGEVLGIIGANGAGKSTLLKILSGITEPTNGRAFVRGRIASLLEVGTGFHPDLTGLENIYLNGTILGMTKTEVDSKRDEIVAFSGLNRFIDTPVKRYSSGMRVRLAFAVAAHLDPEVLLIDEVLAVGDLEFQQKCLSRIEDITQGGRTVLFVSHDLGAIKAICSHALLFSGGVVAGSGPPSEVIEKYLHRSSESPTFEYDAKSEIRVADFKTLNSEGIQSTVFENHEAMIVEIRYEVREKIENALVGFDFLTSEGTQIFRSYDFENTKLTKMDCGMYESRCKIPLDIFQNGKYLIKLKAGIHRRKWITNNSVSLTVDINRSRVYDVDYSGPIICNGSWSVKKIND